MGNKRRTKRTAKIDNPSPSKRIQVLSISDDEDELSRLPSKENHNDIFYEYSPSDEDVVDTTGEVTKTICKGCEKTFSIYSPVDLKQFINHCVKECSEYKFFDLIRVCHVCEKQGMDESSLELHLIQHHECEDVKDHIEENAEKLKLAKTVISDCTSFEEDKTSKAGEGQMETLTDMDSIARLCCSDTAVGGSVVDLTDDDGKPRRSRKEVPLVLNTDDSAQVNSGNKHLDDICLLYIPDSSFGDVVEWTTHVKFTVRTAVCKACKKHFSTMTNSEHAEFMTHCIKGCPEYKALNLIKYCYPCNLYCIDQEAFLEHLMTDKTCMGYPFMQLNNQNKFFHSLDASRKSKK